LTQFHLGEKIGVAESTISLYESGKREPDIATLNNIADFFGVSIDYLLGRENLSTSSVAPASRITELSKEDLALLEVARQLKSLPDTDRKEIESYIQYKEHSNKNKKSTV
jgi:transcriptional regulator with XRE-family HTH domain